MELFYREKGKRSLPPLILLHGLWGASDNWLPVADLLSEHFHVLLPDFRNHGHSPHAPEHHYKILSQDIETWITQQHLNTKPFLVGHSMGGKTLMYLLLKKPEIARRAAIIDICPRSYLPQDNDLHQILLEYLSRFPLHSYSRREEIHQAILADLSDPTLCQILFKNIRKSPSGFTWKINVEAIRSHLNELLDWPLHTPTPYPWPILFIKGELSGYLTQEDLPRIHSYFPKAQLIIIQGASHSVHTDAPKTLANTLSTFFLSQV